MYEVRSHVQASIAAMRGMEGDREKQQRETYNHVMYDR